ncbi:MAG TPA: hypothetical protein VNT79_16095 [Phycisphaerae bacterium]|nr:hypothetical protein [Phycisphaerae bacterium]
MKFPNFRLYDTQAKAAVVFGVLGLLSVVALAVFVFHGFKTNDMTIYYNAQQGMGRFRPWLVRGATCAALLVGVAAGALGFNSLGQKRNDKQNLSWTGLLTGALSISLAGVLFYAWTKLSETIISG